MDELIGRWVQRTRRDRKGSNDQRWHLVQSQIQKDVVAKCGRRMAQEAGGLLDDGTRRYGMHSSPVVPIGERACSFCATGAMFSRPV